MGTISKALALLDTLSLMDKDAGLTEIAQACSLDKATARRFLVELESHGFVEQLTDSRKYRIGSAPVRLGRIREARYPFVRTAIPFVRQLVDETCETVHLSEFTGGRLSTVHVEDSTKAHRVFVAVGTLLPFHATASGIAFISSCPQGEIEAALMAPMPSYTDYTPKNAEAFRQLVKETQANGFSINRQGMEAGVVSASAAIKAPGARPVGCITVAAPLVRANEETVHAHGIAVREAARKISDAFFGADRQTRSALPLRRSI